VARSSVSPGRALATMKAPKAGHWQWTPSDLVGIKVEAVRRVVLAELEDLKRWVFPVPPGVRLGG